MALYVYCIIPHHKEENFSAQTENQIYHLQYRDIAAVVADCEEIKPELNEQMIKEHQAILETVMERYTVVPMAFGMAFKNREILRTVLKKCYTALKQTLKLLHNKIEVGVKVILTEEALKKEKDFNFGVWKADIENTLSEKAGKTVQGKLFSDRLLSNMSFLIEKDDLDKFSSSVEQLEKKYPQLKFQYSGPWPAYSFVDIKIRAE